MPAQGAHCISITITLCTTEVNSSDSTMIPNTTRVEIGDATIPTLHTRTVYIPTSRCCLNYHHHSHPFRVALLRTETMITQLLFVDSHYTAPSLKLLDMVSLYFSQSFSTTTSHPTGDHHLSCMRNLRSMKGGRRGWPWIVRENLKLSRKLVESITLKGRLNLIRFVCIELR